MDKQKEWEYKGLKFTECPNCKKGIPVQWKSHKCGWNIELENPKVSESDYLRRYMEESANIIASIFDMGREELKEAILKDSGFSQMIDCIFIERCKERNNEFFRSLRK